MELWQQIVLLATGLIAIYMIYFFIKKQQDSEKACSCNWYFIASFAVLLVAGLILIFADWEALEHPFVDIVAGIIPFGLAIGLIKKFHPDFEMKALIFFAIGLVLILISRLGEGEPALWGRIIYPLFHATAGLTIFFVPIFAVKNEKINSAFINVTIGGTIIGIGGIALAFLKAGKPLLGILDEPTIHLILAPILFLTALFFALGFVKSD